MSRGRVRALLGSVMSNRRIDSGLAAGETVVSFIVQMRSSTAERLAVRTRSGWTHRALVDLIEQVDGRQGGASADFVPEHHLYTYNEHRADSHDGNTCPEGNWKQCVQQARSDQIRDLIAILDDLSDADDCQFDHNGDCQAHGFFGLRFAKIECPNRLAREAVERHNGQ